MATLAFVFPGQGSATVGMGLAIAQASPAAARILDRLAELHPDVRKLIEEGPKDELIRTANAQPAIFAVDCACLAALEERGIRPDIVAGHSLGEYAALVAAGVVDFETGLRLVVERGARMEESTSARPGTMLAVLGLTTEQVDEIVARWQECGVIANANDNAPGQIVVSGEADVLSAAAADFRESGARVMELAVGGAFHSALMADGERAFRPTLVAAPFVDGRVPLVSNYTAMPSTDAATLKAALQAQITGRVRWRESVEAMVATGADAFVEVGPGKVLSGIVQRCTKGRPVTVLNVEDPASLEKTVDALRA